MESFTHRLHIQHSSSIRLSYAPDNTYAVLRNLVGEGLGLPTAYRLVRTPGAGSEEVDLPEVVVPLRNVAVVETNTLTFVELLGMRAGVDYIEGDGPLIHGVTSPCLRWMYERDEAPSTSALSNKGTAERTAELEGLDAWLGSHFQYSNVNYTFDPPAVLEGVYIAESITDDTSDPLGRAEWIKFMGILFGKEKEADELFQATVERYECHREEALKHAAKKDKPVVAWLSQFGGWSVNVNYNQWVTDAGGIPFSPLQTFYAPSDMALLRDELMNVDVVVDMSYSVDTRKWEDILQELGLNDASPQPFVQNKRVFASDKLSNHANAYDFYESALPEPDVLLEDMMEILWPGQVQKKHERVWMRLLNPAEAVQRVPVECSVEEAHAPLLVRAEDCKYGSNVGAITAIVLVVVIALGMLGSWLYIRRRKANVIDEYSASRMVNEDGGATYQSSHL